jgi:NADPH:quinone reductase-like Zn-dependent oxidoreductase
MPSALPTKVRSLLQPDIQSTEVILTELPFQPARGNSEEHVIKVYATAPCAGELLWAKNYPGVVSKGSHEMVPCYDLSGVVATAPTDSPFQPGTEVYTRTNAARAGNAREYSITLTSELAIKPKNLTWEEAASIPLSLFTAYQALFTHGELKKGWKNPEDTAANANKRVLITAAAGGVGVLLVQLAKAAGVKEIIGIAGPANVDFLKDVGASEVINYRQQSLGDWMKQNEQIDLVVDAMGGKTLEDAWGAVKEGGILLSIRQPPETCRPKNDTSKKVDNKFFIMESLGWQLDEVKELLENKTVKPVVDSIWKLEEFNEAFAIVERGHARGKVIIKVQDPS